MKPGNVALGIVAAILLGGAGYGLYSLGMNRGMQMTAGPASGDSRANPGAPQKAGDVDPQTGRKVLYWHDPMAPGQKFDKPGKSPFMDMQLVPVYEDGAGGSGGIAVDPRMQQSLGLRTAEVTRAAVGPVVEAVGSIAWNERDVAVVQARAAGFLEKLYVRAPLDPVRRGQPLAELYVPDWVAAQEEYLSARRFAGTRMEALVDGARQRMRLAGMTDEQIRAVDTSGAVQARLVVLAPISGVVGELGAREGMTLAAGAQLFRINGLATVWVNAEVRESEAAQIRTGNAVEARVTAVPGKVFKGRVSAILPEVNPATRTMKARVEIANPGGELKPGMFASVNFSPGARREILVVPSEAVIQTGRRSVVIVVQSDGRFSPATVEAGVEAGGRTEIRGGLAAGQKVVVSGQFLIDSEASLRASEARMSQAAGNAPDAAAPGAQSGPATHKGTGRVVSLDVAAASVELEHGPIPSLKWPAMTMPFQAEDRRQLESLKAGDRVEFELYAKPGQGGDYVLRAIRKSGG